MENRRPPGKPPENSLSRGTNNYRKDGESSQGQRTFQPRTNNFQPRDSNQRNERFQNRDGKTSPPRDDRFQPRDRKYPPREGDRFQPRDSRDNRVTRDNRETRDTRYPRRDDRTSDTRSDTRSNTRTEGFQPRRPFVPRGKPVPAWKNIEKPRIYDEMQITDGKHIGKFVKGTDSPRVRSTARRVREILFKLTFRRVRAGRVLDLCAGAGTVGIEAISRGALIGSFVERSAKMCGIIKKNLASLEIKEGHGEIFEMEAVPFLKQMAKRRRFWDLVFFDPPYDTNYDEVLSYLSRGISIKPGGMLVIEHHAEMFFPEKLGVLSRWRVVAVGETTLSFYERK